ncbi:serine hydrolase domain-containing protein [Streptomyces cremeus]|uniref:serine hydrolase domain-containing protein n=1 Tax=Streptomyces cremeus TaxID=66881 RepID=UPI0031E9BE22
MSGIEVEVEGTVAAGYEGVREEFAAALADPDEGPDHSAQLAVYVRGELVVDLWGGPGIGADSLTPVYSVTKGAVYLVVALLVQDGVLELDREVASYWPEFGAHGKDRLTLRELLAHRAGVVGADTGFTAEELADDRAIAARLAGQRPYWRPGTAVGYHAFVVGALADEVVRRVTGRSVREIYEERVRAPYGLDFFVGLPDAEAHRVLDTLPMTPTAAQQAEIDADPFGAHSLGGIAFNLNAEKPTDLVEAGNSYALRANGQLSAGGVGSARGIAGMYRAVLGDGVERGGAAVGADAGRVRADPVRRGRPGRGAREPVGVRGGVPGDVRGQVPGAGAGVDRAQRGGGGGGVRRSPAADRVRVQPEAGGVSGRGGGGERAVGEGGGEGGFRVGGGREASLRGPGGFSPRPGGLSPGPGALRGRLCAGSRGRPAGACRGPGA